LGSSNVKSICKNIGFRAVNAFHYVHLVTVHMARLVKPSQFLDIGGVDHQRVAS